MSSPINDLVSDLNSTQNIIEKIICRDDIINVSIDNAASAQASFSDIITLDKTNIFYEAYESLVNEVALTKKTILNSDERVIIVKEGIIIGNNIIPEPVRFTNLQLTFLYPNLAPFE